MASAGVRVDLESTGLSAVGLVEVARTIPRAVNAFLRVSRLIKEKKTDAAILISCEGFNVPLGWWLRQKGVLTISYFPPQVWMWKRVARFAASSFDVILTSFPEEFEVYIRTRSVTSFTGHYLKDILEPATDEERKKARSTFYLSESEAVLALLPGSRRTEIETFGPLLIDVAVGVSKRIHKARFLLPLAHPDFRGFIDEQLESSGLRGAVTVCSSSYQAMKASDVGLIASGTASLEAAILGLPHILFYRLSPATVAAVRLLHRCRILDSMIIGLPNLVAGCEVIPEILQCNATPDNLVKELLSLLKDRRRCAQMRTSFRKISQMLGDGRSLERAARTILHCACLRADGLTLSLTNDLCLRREASSVATPKDSEADPGTPKQDIPL
jgi:lipid-A-disaccharide synthase